jgi:hypothetical protein
VRAKFRSGFRLFLLRFLLLRIDQRLAFTLPLGKAAGTDHLVTVFDEYVRGTRGSCAAVSNRDDQLVPGDLAEAGFELAEGNVDVAFDAAQLLDLFGFAHVEEE